MRRLGHNRATFRKPPRRHDLSGSCATLGECEWIMMTRIDVAVNVHTVLGRRRRLYVCVRDAAEQNPGKRLMERRVRVPRDVDGAKPLRIASVDIKSSMPSVVIELWSPADKRGEPLYEYIGAVGVDLGELCTGEGHGRWYRLDRPRDSHPLMVNEAFLLEGDVFVTACLPKTIADDVTLPKCEAATLSETDRFRFVWPSRVISKRSRLRSVNIGEITHEGRIDILQAFLADTLSGDSLSLSHRSSIDNSTDVHHKAMVLSQFACQYTMHCVDQLQAHSSALEERLQELHVKRDQLMQQHTTLSRKRSSRAKELELTMSTLDDIDRIVSQLADNEASTRS